MFINFFKIDIPFEEFQVQVVPYQDDIYLSLKSQYNHAASFFRHANNLFVSPSVGFAEKIGELQTINVQQYPEVVRSLIRHMLFRAFRNDDKTSDMLPISFSPLSFHSRVEAHDPILEHLPKAAQDFIRYPRTNQIYVKSICPRGTHTFGLVAKSRHTWKINRSLNFSSLSLCLATTSIGSQNPVKNASSRTRFRYLKKIT